MFLLILKNYYKYMVFIIPDKKIKDNNMKLYFPIKVYYFFGNEQLKYLFYIVIHFFIPLIPAPNTPYDIYCADGNIIFL